MVASRIHGLVLCIFTQLGFFQAAGAGTLLEAPGKLPVLDLKKDKLFPFNLVPGLVPYADEVHLQGEANFDPCNLGKFKNKCLLAEPGCSKNILSLYRGRVLFDCTNDVYLSTPDARVKIARGSIVYVYSTGESLAVLNLHDLHRRSVVLELDHEKIEIPPGREILLTRYCDLEFDEARLTPGIWYRSVYELPSRPGLKLFLTQFSTISAAAIFPSVHKLTAKKNKSGDRLVKTFAAVIKASRDGQQFRPNMNKSSFERELGMLSQNSK